MTPNEVLELATKIETRARDQKAPAFLPEPLTFGRRDELDERVHILQRKKHPGAARLRIDMASVMNAISNELSATALIGAGPQIRRRLVAEVVPSAVVD